MRELGAGFNALFIAMRQKGLNVLAEQPFEVMFRNRKVGKYVAERRRGHQSSSRQAGWDRKIKAGDPTLS